jgi:hypothetical protein
VRALWAHGAGARDIARGIPETTGNELRFRFACGDPNFRALVSQPGLSARIAINAVDGQPIGVTFRGRSRK